MVEGGGPVGVLFLCTGNSARSILAECLLRELGQGRFATYSAGSQPKPAPHPMALRLLAERGHATEGLRSKSWGEFAAAGAPSLDCVITVCDAAAGESCPIWPGHPTTAHWGLPDPAAVEGPESALREAFERAYEQLEERIRAFLALPLADLEGAELLERLRAIGTRGNP
ncbi:MAG: arsenate reductase ArsC [Deltaproteobacteria bacterium]|nr:arsenate reductase ArsC [Deltaproteobacteria bacterium]MBW2362612.1 arsenate reductase ArsC [Deltaproteobacteria bacterium]